MSEETSFHPYRDVIAYSIIEGSAGIRAAEHAKDFQTANWTDALRSADSVIACLAALSQPTPVEAGALDWRRVAKLAGEFGIRYRTNAAFEQFLAALSQPGSSESGGEEVRNAAEAIALDQAEADKALKEMARKEKDGQGALIHAAEEAAARSIAHKIRKER